MAYLLSFLFFFCSKLSSTSNLEERLTNPNKQTKEEANKYLRPTEPQRFYENSFNFCVHHAANILDVTCINFNPIYDTSSSASYAAILNGADVTSMVSFQRSVDLDTGDRQSTWCSSGDDEGACGLPQGSTIDSSGRVTFQNTDQDTFGVYGCRAERYNWMTETSTIFIRNDGEKKQYNNINNNDNNYKVLIMIKITCVNQ